MMFLSNKDADLEAYVGCSLGFGTELWSSIWTCIKTSICVYLDCLESLSALDSFCQVTALPAGET